MTCPARSARRACAACGARCAGRTCSGGLTLSCAPPSRAPGGIFPLSRLRRPMRRRAPRLMKGTIRTLVALALLTVFGAVRADPAVAQFAGGQLAMAEAALEQARAALQAHDYALVRRLA